MTAGYTFDPSHLEDIIQEYGLRGAWVNLLATHLARLGSVYSYVLDSDVLKGHALLADDMLTGMTIGQVGVLYEYSVAHVDPRARKQNGQYFTPDDVAILMAKQSQLFPKGNWLDPCSGIGNLSWHLVNIQDNKEDFVIDSMVLSDRDELALLIARVLFTVSFQHKYQDFFHRIANSFVTFDFLSVADNSSDQDQKSTPGLSAVPVHDYVIVNPPYLSLSQEDSRFETARARDLYAYFLENIIKSSKGFVSITPQSFTNAGRFEPLRRLLLERYESLTVYAFDNVPGNIFMGVKFASANTNTQNSVRACITVAGPFLDPTGRRITPLLRWRSSERDVLFTRLDEFLGAPSFSDAYFPKVAPELVSLYRMAVKHPTLQTLFSKTPTKHVLYVPATPRYFISALKKPVSRKSMRLLYFKNVSDLNTAYVLINSSFMYWWWRVRDGGMTLSLETLSSLPILPFKVERKLVRKLVKSESTNVVYKQNAGAIQENVKHDPALIVELNGSVVPARYAKLLIRLHQNSDITPPRRTRRN